MSPELSAKFDQLDLRMEAMLTRIAAYEPSVQDAPVGKSFSPKAVAEHMMITDKNYVGMVNPALASKSAKPSFIYNFVLKAMQKPVRQVTPAPKMFVPSGAKSVSESSAGWREARASLRKLIADVPDTTPFGGNWMMGRLSPKHLHDLLSYHQDYHDARLP